MDDTVSVPDAEARAMGAAVRALRDEKGLSQPQAGARMKPSPVTAQAWANYEAGKRRFTEVLIGRICAAIGVSRDELISMRNRQLAEGAAPTPRPQMVREAARVFELPVWGRARAGPSGPELHDEGEPEQVIDLRTIFGATTRALRVAGESMTGYVEPGELVIYDTATWPRRGHGCVVELHSGNFLVKLYEKTDGSTLFLREHFPEERTLDVSMAEVKGVYAVRLRGD